ncbi:MAG: Gfo/Idh/MocA family oxidoreductase [Lachnospiraceae bacterium]|nr:Gfo/Idh/MocA family oxidoreductase [Lachnospiraceae bacterium]
MNISILGAGNIAGIMATTLQPLKDVTCYAVAARDKDRAQVFADKYGFLKAYGSYKDMLEDPDVELVYIATPHSHHYEHIKMCLAHGKHVLCEKAFTANARQAEEVLRLAESKGLLLTEAMWIRYMPMARKIVEVVNSGIIGHPTSLSANLGYPLEHVERLTKLSLCGGALLDLGVYVLNFASMVFGNDIESMAANCVKYPRSGVDAQETIMLTYRDGRMATLYATMLAQTDRRGFIHGTNGYIEIENINNFESIKVFNLERRVVAEYAAPMQVTGYEYEIMSAMKAIREGQIECPEMPHVETLFMMQLMDNIRAAWNIRFPYEVERVEEDPEEDPVVTARKAEEAKRAEEAKKAAEEARKKTEEAKKRAEEKQAEEAAAREEAAKALDAPTDPDDFEDEPVEDKSAEKKTDEEKSDEGSAEKEPEIAEESTERK